MRHRFFFGGLVAAGLTPSAFGQILMPDSTGDKVLSFDAFDGHLLNAAFIDLAPATPNTPINALLVGNEIWVSDQVSDNVTRWSLDGTTLLGTIGGGATGGLDNIRGIEVVGSTLYIANAGTSNGAPGEAVVTVDINTYGITGSFTVGDDASGDPFDVLAYNGGLLINDIDGDDLESHDTAGAWLSTFHDSDGATGIDFPEQIALTSRGTILAAGFSSPIGIFEYDSNGNEINYFAVGTGNRGVIELGNGNIMFSDGGGVYSLDPSTGGVTTILTGVSGRYFELIPEPATLALLALGGVLALRRR